MANLDDAFYPSLWDFARETGAPPEWFLDIFLLESGLNTASHRAGSDYYGLNQINGPWLKQHGIDPADYLTWSASRQFETVVKPFYRDLLKNYLKKPARSMGVLYALNLLPGRVLQRGDAPEAVLTSSPESFYAKNSGLDFSKDGAITIDDLDRFLARKWKEVPPAVLAKLYAAGPSDWAPLDLTQVLATPPVVPGVVPFSGGNSMEHPVVATVLVGLLGGLAAFVGYESLAKKPIRNPRPPAYLGAHEYDAAVMARALRVSKEKRRFTIDGEETKLMDFIRNNNDTFAPDDILYILDLRPGESIKFGGGSYPISTLRRIA